MDPQEIIARGFHDELVKEARLYKFPKHMMALLSLPLIGGAAAMTAPIKKEQYSNPKAVTAVDAALRTPRGRKILKDVQKDLPTNISFD